MSGYCNCCAGLVDFDLFEDTCDECATAILSGNYSPEAHGHEPSPEQQVELDRFGGAR